MGSKRALIVDDSKSARHFLFRILTDHGIECDTAESAEQALEYLAANRPDVIFMDHLMPGMDGFQAVQVIKSNPATAAIPVMMYTSQQGELYLGQARAVGAVGVLSKQINPSDILKVLYQLHLVPDRRSYEPPILQPVDADGLDDTNELAAPVVQPAEPPAPIPLVNEARLQEQLQALRSTLLEDIDARADRIIANVRQTIREALPPPPAVPEPRTSGWMTACAVLLAIAVGSAALWLRESTLRRSLDAELRERIEAQFNARQEALAESLRPGAAPATPASVAEPLPTSPDAAPASTDGTMIPAGGLPGADAVSMPTSNPLTTQPSAASRELLPVVELVPYGSDPLAGPRADRVRQLLARLAAEGHKGTVEIRIFPGRFCLVGNGSGGYLLAPDDLPQARCELVGNPYDESLTAAQRVPPQITELLAQLRSATQGALEVRVVTGRADETAIAYPTPGERLTAGEWNHAARVNNRIEIVQR